MKTALEAVHEVLAKAGRPLHYREITERILADGLWHTAGKTPTATIVGLLSTDVKKKGADSKFERVGNGMYTLRTAQSGLGDQDGVMGSDAEEAGGPPSPKSSLSFTDAAERILANQDHPAPMYYKVITEKAVQVGLLVSGGKTPDATMYSQIMLEHRRQTLRGEIPRFTKFDKGRVGLSRWAKTGLAHQIDEHNREVRKRLHQQIMEMPPGEFEDLVARLLSAIGFDSPTVTPYSGDSGIDVRGTLVVGDVIKTKMAVQVKRWKANVQANVVREVRGSLGAHEHAMIITTSGFSAGALAEAKRSDATPVALMDGDQLVSLLIENDIGIRRTSHDLIELGEGTEEG